MPHHGIFVLERLRAWRQRHGGDAVVVAPIPWVPSALARGRYRVFRETAKEETRDGFRVIHPRYLVIPKVGMTLTPWTMALGAAATVRRLLAEGQRFDLIDAHYLYPDAVAAAILRRAIDLPLVVTARGTDVNLIPRRRLPRAWLTWMLRRADAVIAVAEALRISILEWAPGTAVNVLCNGVDLDRFRPLDRDRARAELGWPRERRILLSVGHLVERKGHHHAITALRELGEEVELRIIGSGTERKSLQALAQRLGVAGRTRFEGSFEHQRLATAYSAADLLILLSSREGWPNVLLESMACGTPVVATRVHGTPEVVTGEEVGLLVGNPRGAEVVVAVRELLSHPRNRDRVRAFAEKHSWGPVVDAMQALFESITARRSSDQEHRRP